MADEEEDKNGEPFVARRTESVDSEGIIQLMKKKTENVFGRINVDDVIEKANLAVTLAGKYDKVLAFAAFYDHPSAKDVKQSEWGKWFHTICQCPQANPLNSLFMRLFVSQEDVSEAALAEILRTVFVAVPFLQYIFLQAASDVNIGSSLITQFSPLPYPTTGEEEDSTPSVVVYVTQRHLHYPMLHIRPAIVEDNDDLLPILEQCSPEGLTERYGEYFIAELIESQDDTHQTVVAEVNGKGVGFVSVTTEVDLSVLWECYQLEPYLGLRKLCDEDVITTATLPQENNDTTNNPLASCSKQTSSTISQQSSNKDEQPNTDQAEAMDGASSTSIESETSKNKGSKPADAASSDSTPLQSTAQDHAPIDSTHSVPNAVPTCEKQYSFKGPSNVISVQLFCMDEQYESRSVDLLPAVFEKFPEYDFLIISQPQNILEFPLLQHFTRVPPRIDSTISHELYVLHKCSLLDSFSVRPVEERDMKSVTTLATSLEAEGIIVEDVQRYLIAGRDPSSEDGTPLYAFVAECADQIVGVVVLRPEQSLSYLRSHYNIEDYVYFSQHLPNEHMNIHHLLISPVFAPHLKHFLKESMRLSHSNNLYYPLKEMAAGSKRPFSITLALAEMIPIKPRRQIIYPNDLSINTPEREVMEARPLYTLYHTNRKLSMEPKIVVNARIVFIGASDVSLSSLETLVFSPHLKFNNLTLVSPYGLPQTTSTNTSLLPDSCCFLNEALRGISLEAWVNIVPGVLTAINRNNSEISVSMCDTLEGEESTVPYDYLVITTGSQYIPERPINERVPEEGVITINGNFGDKQRLEKAKQQIANDGNIVVYGSSIVALSTLNHILDKWDIPGDRVTWVHPNPTTPLFPGPVQDKLDATLSSAGVRILQGYTLDRYETITSGKDNTSLIGAVCTKQIEESKEIEEVLVDCEVIFCSETRDVDRRTFTAVNDACIVYDGRIVINCDNTTNDKHILAAGSATKFSRFYRTEWSHIDFNSREVGQNLAKTILSKLDPTSSPSTQVGTLQSDTPTSLINDNRLIPTYVQPKIVYAQLPGGHYYLKVNKPCLEGTGETKEGVELFTNTDNGYFRLWINEYERVQTITVFSAKPFEVSNYICLYDIHEKLLNDLMSRWKDNMITDFYMYFREDWTCAIFHDRFVEFLAEIQNLLDTPVEGEEKSLMEKTRDIITDCSHVSVEYNLKSFLHLSDNLQDAVQKRLRKYLHYNGYHLTMYAQPDLV